ncbi:hypothetical protein N0V90_000159 [Kalmusia sp. IMI 367209]|nr:hypothetical protein N0V90_000159 [Kalmusia sp. IMI 367209]
MPDYSFYITTPRLAITYFDASKEPHVAFTKELYKAYTKVDENGNIKPTIPDHAAAIKLIEERAAQIDSTGYGRYLISVLPSTDADITQRVETATPVGLVGLNLRGPDTPPVPDIGFNLLPSARGKGYATEAVAGLLGWYEREKGVTEVLGYCDDDNEGSKAVLRRSGFELVGYREIGAFMNSGGIPKERQPGLLVWTRGLKGELKDYGLQEVVKV